ncbi:MAG: hypothetical protein CVU07_13440, partial [Bacteroidetes bacterium HGW-Bacteroidetes-23]
MKIRFYLRKSTNSYSIIFEFRNSNDNIRLRTSTGFSVKNSKEWDSKKERIKIPSSVYGATSINSKLSEALYKFEKLISTIEEQNISEDIIKEIMLDVFSKTPNNKKTVEQGERKDLINYYLWFLDYYSVHNSPFSKKKLAQSTLKTYKTGLSRLQEYIESRKLKRFSFNDCNREFYNDYILYLTSLNYSKNYVGTIIQKLKTILGFAYDEGIHNNNEFKKSYFSKMTEEIDHVYLSIAELQNIQ